MNQCYVDGEFKPPRNTFACWAFSMLQISMLTICDCFLEFKQGRCKNFLHFQRQLPTLKEAHLPVALSKAVNLQTADDGGTAIITLMYSINFLWGRALTATFVGRLGHFTALSYGDQNFHGYTHLL